MSLLVQMVILHIFFKIKKLNVVSWIYITPDCSYTCTILAFTSITMHHQMLFVHLYIYYFVLRFPLCQILIKHVPHLCHQNSKFDHVSQLVLYILPITALIICSKHQHFFAIRSAERLPGICGLERRCLRPHVLCALPLETLCWQLFKLRVVGVIPCLHISSVTLYPVQSLDKLCFVYDTSCRFVRLQNKKR